MVMWYWDGVLLGRAMKLRLDFLEFGAGEMNALGRESSERRHVAQRSTPAPDCVPSR